MKYINLFLSTDPDGFVIFLGVISFVLSITILVKFFQIANNVRLMKDEIHSIFQFMLEKQLYEMKKKKSETPKEETPETES